MRPQEHDFPLFFGNYIKLVYETKLDEAFKTQDGILEAFLKSFPEDKWDYRYAENKWTIKELIQHCIDAERIFSYRALCFARKETNSLPSFDENIYADNSDAGRRSADDLIAEYITLRLNTKQLFQSFSHEMLSYGGLANNNRMTVLSLGYTLLGHFIHHKKVLEERYFPVSKNIQVES